MILATKLISHVMSDNISCNRWNICLYFTWMCCVHDIYVPCIIILMQCVREKNLKMKWKQESVKTKEVIHQQHISSRAININIVIWKSQSEPLGDFFGNWPRESYAEKIDRPWLWPRVKMKLINSHWRIIGKHCLFECFNGWYWMNEL